MWKDYSSSYIKNNRASGISVMVAAFISALLLSLLCSIFYNIWAYEVDRLKREEGDWQGRITGEISEEALEQIRNYANVESAVINGTLSETNLEERADRQPGEQSKEQPEEPSDSRSEEVPEVQAKEQSGPVAGQGESAEGQKAKTVVDITFRNMRSILKDMPRIAELAGLPPESVSYNYALLNLYLIRDPEDPAPRMIFPLFLAVTVMACVSLVMIIHNSFAVSMNARIHQFGILSSIGATPGQIRACLLQEAAVLCCLPIVAGTMIGIAISAGLVEGMNRMLADVAWRIPGKWEFHPLILVLSLLITMLTVWLSAWIPARKMGRITPISAIRNTGELRLKRKKCSPWLAVLFGIEGELAGNALKAQKKALRTANLSLTISFLAFTLAMCFFTLTAISQRMTYFERYQDAWDVMATIKGTEIDAFEDTAALQGIPGPRSVYVYQKASAKWLLTEEMCSDAFLAMGGLGNASPSYVTASEGGWLVNAPVLILDDASFLDYCNQVGAPAVLGGCIIINRIRDVNNPNFRDVQYSPYLKETQETTVLCRVRQEDITAQIPVLFYTKQLPVLKEAYGEVDYYELVHVLPVSVWREIKGQIGGAEKDLYVRILAGEGAEPEEVDEIARSTEQLLGGSYETVIENRIQDRRNNEAMIDGMMMIFGGFCVLLAIIGIGNVFANTLGFVRQRRRELARYLSVGLTPQGIRKMFCVEALVIAGRPALITLPLTVAAVWAMTKASYLEPVIFLREAPVVPILAFFLAILAFVALAYYLGGKRALKCSLMEALRDDTVM